MTGKRNSIIPHVFEKKHWKVWNYRGNIVFLHKNRKIMSDEIKNTTPELEGMVVSEPAAGYATSSQEPIQFLDDTEFLDYDFREEDFGYPRSLEELQAALDLADEERNDPSKWVSSVDFHQRLEDKYTWLR